MMENQFLFILVFRYPTKTKRTKIVWLRWTKVVCLCKMLNTELLNLSHFLCALNSDLYLTYRHLRLLRQTFVNCSYLKNWSYFIMKYDVCYLFIYPWICLCWHGSWEHWWNANYCMEVEKEDPNTSEDKGQEKRGCWRERLLENWKESISQYQDNGCWHYIPVPKQARSDPWYRTWGEKHS